MPFENRLRSDCGRIELEIRELHPGGEHERVVEAIDEPAGYHGIVAIHSTKLGPAVGGTRVWPYKSFDEALTDALRLSRGMTYKAALAGLPFGGGKGGIIRQSGSRSKRSGRKTRGAGQNLRRRRGNLSALRAGRHFER